MPTETEERDTFDVRRDGALIAAYDPADYPTPEAVIADVATWIETANEIVPGAWFGFEVWRGGAMVATARRDGDTNHFIPGPPFDRTRGMPAAYVEAFDKFFPSVLDHAGPGLEGDEDD